MRQFRMSNKPFDADFDEEKISSKIHKSDEKNLDSLDTCPAQPIRTLKCTTRYNEAQKRKPAWMERSSISHFVFEKRAEGFTIPRYQNSYRLESYNSFKAEVVDKILREVMENKLTIFSSYQPSIGTKLCSEISSEVRKAIAKKNFDRYKIVVQVSIVQRLFQGINVGSKCLWDVDRDNYSYYVFENSNIYAWCCVFGLYYE